MANRPLSPRTDGYKPSFQALLISFSVVCLVLYTPILPPSDIPNYRFPLANPTLRNLTLFSAALTNSLVLAHLKLRMSKPIVSATDERFSLITLCAACVTLILGLFFALKVVILDPLTVRAAGGQGGGGGGGQIEDVVNLFMQNRKFGG